MISSLSNSHQLTRAGGRCQAQVILRPIALKADRRCSVFASAPHGVRSSIETAANGPRQSTEQQGARPQQQVSTTPIALSSSQQGQQWRFFTELLTTHTSFLAFAVLMLYLLPTEPAAADGLHQHPSSLFDLAEGEEGIVSNAIRYARYFVTVLLGTGYVMVQPLIAAFKKPVTAIVAIVGVAGSAYLLKLTLDAMLGIQEPFNYEAGSIVPYS